MKRIFCVVAVSLLFCSCEKVFFGPEPANEPVAVFNQFWNDFNEYYAVFEERGVDWDSMYQVYAPQVGDGTTDDELFAVLSAMIKPLDDGHVNLIAPGRKQFSSNHIYRDSVGFTLWDLEVIRQSYLGGTAEGADSIGYVYGLINGEIIYVYFTYIADNLPVMDDIIAQYPAAKGMIIDLRHSFGGDFTWAFQYFGRFTDQSRLVFQSATKNGPGKDDYDDWYPWYLEPAGHYFSKPLVLLTDRYTISASERTVMALKVIPGVVQIGDTTNGAHSTMIGRELQNSWYYTLSPQKILFADGKSYEGIGMIPDIVLFNTVSNLENGIDDQLDKAIEVLQ
ncbi:MAG: S41 family peptidase [Chitinophagales bacterium]|nr:S41 family peptidase [Chitinophagales bacterium]